METVARFKGLENSLVIIWGMDDLQTQKSNEVLYLGLSRATSVLKICGSKNSCNQL